MDTDDLRALLTETERGDREGLDAVGLQASARVHDEVEVFHDLVDVVGVAVSGDNTSVQHLQGTVQHPSTGSALGVTGEELLEDTQNGVALGASQVLELLADDRRLVLVVGLGGGSVEGSDAQVVDREAPGRESATNGGDAGISLPEVVSEAAEDLLLLADGLLLDVLETIREVLLDLHRGLALGLHSLDLDLEILDLGLFVVLDLPLATLDLSSAVVDVQQRRRELASMLASAGQHTLAGSRDGPADLVGSSGRHGEDTVDGQTHVQGELGRHDDLDTRALRLHEAVPGGSGGPRHLLRGAAVLELIDRVAGSLHVGKLVRAFLAEVVKTTHEADACLAFHDGLVTNVDGLDSGSAGADGSLDRARRREEKHVHPSSHGVDEGLLENVILERLVEEPVAVHAAEGCRTAHTRTNAVSDFRYVDILVELVRVGDTGREQSLGSSDENEESDGVHLRDDVVGHTVPLGIPAAGDLTSDEAVEAESLGNPETRALLHADGILAGLGDLKDLDLVAMLPLELFGSLLRGLKGIEILFDDDLVEKLLPVRVVSVEQFGLDQTDTRVLQDVLLVLLLDILVVDGLARLGVHPAGVLVALDGAIVILDETHDPGHLDAALQREFAEGFHLPASSGVAPGTDLGETSDDDDLLEVDHAPELVIERGHLGLPVRQVGELKLDVGAGLDDLLLVENLRVLAIDNLVLDGSLLGDGPANLAGVHDILAELGHHLVQLGDELETTVQIGKDRLVLAEVDEDGGHQTQEVESHLLLREGANTEGLDALGHDVVARHETGATGPADDGTADGQVVGPVLRYPSVEQGLQTELGLRVQTVVAESTVVGGEGQDHLGRARLKSAAGLLSLDTAQQADQVGQHDAVSQLGLGVDAIDLAAVLGDGSEGDDDIEIPAETSLGVVDVFDQSIDVLLTALVERNHNELRVTRAVTGIHGLVVLSHLTGETTGGDDNLGATADEALQDFSADGSGTGTRHQRVLSGEADAVLGGFLEAVEVETGQLLAVVPAVQLVSLAQVEEGDGLDLALRLERCLLGGAVVGLAVLLGDDLALVHGQRAEDISVQALDLELRGLGELVLLLDELVDAR